MKGYYSMIIALVIVTSTANKVSVKKSECPPGEQIVRLPHPNKCTMYYICENGKKTIQTCPGGLHFNPIIKQCDWPPGCFPSFLGLKIKSAEIENGDPSKCVGKCPAIDPTDRTVHLPYAGDCTKFCACSNGRPYVSNCPEGLHFDKKKMICNWPRDAKCQQ